MYQDLEQRSPAPRAGVDNVFFALTPEVDSASQAITIQTDYLSRLGHKPYLVPRDCLHVSLLDIGVKKNLILRSFNSTIDLAIEAAGKLKMAPFEVVFNQVLSFGAKSALKPFVLKMSTGEAQVLELCKKLRLCLATANVHSDDKATTPHMTLARAAETIPLTDVAPVCWTATRLVLIHSVVGETRHIPLKSWPLQQP